MLKEPLEPPGENDDAQGSEPLGPDTPVTQGARRELRRRIKKVWRFAKMSAAHAEEDIEYVHKARVFVRRVTAALSALEPLLPRSRARKMKKALKGLRRAAGDARDLDVLHERLTAELAEKPSERLSAFLAALEQRRRDAQIPLVHGYARLLKKRFPELAAEVIEKLRWRGEGPEPTFAEAARATLAPEVKEFLQAARADLTDVDALHQLRIHAKRVRYALELFSKAFGDRFRQDLKPRFQEFQDRLGIINDHATAGMFFGNWIEEVESGADKTTDVSLLRELAEEEDQLLAETCDAFREWWTAERIEDIATRFEALTSDSADPAEPSSTPGDPGEDTPADGSSSG